MAQLFANDARSKLTGPINATALSLLIDPTDQARFPVATGADWFKVKLENAAGSIEYVRVQRASGSSTLTCTSTAMRGYEDPATFPAASWSSGATVELVATADDLEASLAHPSVGTDAHDASAISVVPAGGIAATNVQAALEELDAEKAPKTAAAFSTSVQVGTLASGTVKIFPGNASTTAGSVEFFEPTTGNRKGYIGWGPTTGRIDLSTDTGWNWAANRQIICDLAATDPSHLVRKGEHDADIATRARMTLTATQPSVAGFNVDFNSVPSWAKKVTVLFDLVSTNGSNLVMVQLGTAAAFLTSGYVGSAGYLNSGGVVGASNLTAGASVQLTSAAVTRTGQIVFEHANSNVWVFSGQVANSVSGDIAYVSGRCSLSDVLTRVRILTAGGVDAFDGGALTCLYEG